MLARSPRQRFRQPRGTQSNIPRVTRSTVVSIPAPIGGWNARDALTAMDITDAIQLDNFIPDAGGVRLRKGYSEHVTPVGTPIQSLMEYNPPGAVPKLFAAVTTAIYNVTTAGVAVGAVAGLTSGRWQHCMFSTTAGSYLVLCNGSDDTYHYDGTSWITPAITNVSSANLINITPHIGRLFFVQKDTLDAWYLPVASIAGAATKIALGAFCKLGGSLLAIASWTRDGGSGIDDHAVFITTKGEAVIYQGSDPASASTWSRVGTFRIPEPVGRRCVVNLGADVGIITSQGVLPLSSILPLSIAGAGKVAVTDKISRAVADAYSGSSTAFGWQLIEYPKDRILILNVPISESVETEQFVMNTQIGSWCKFTDIPAGCWALKGDELYFGGHDGAVYKYGSGFTDDGEEINAVSISAFSNLGSPITKNFVMARGMIYGPDDYYPLLALRIDYELGAVTYEATVSEGGGARWDEAIWDDAAWSGGLGVRPQWQAVTGLGSVVAVALAVSVSDEVRFNAVDLMYEPAEPGGYL